MITPSTGRANGFQVAFLIGAILLLAAPLDKYVLSHWQWARDVELPTGRIAIFALAAAILICVPGLRRESRALLRPPIPVERLNELPMAMAVHIVAALGAFGAFALWNWSVGGEPALARKMGETSSHAVQWAQAISPAGMTLLLLGAIVAPLVEEIAFRGLLYRAWRERFGWIAGTVGTSAAFGLSHGAFLPQFLGSIVLVCVMRRTGSLWAPILVHAAFNTLLWYPFLGQFMLPAGRSTGELHVWWLQLACLAVTAVALPVYLWKSRDAKVPPAG